MNKIISLALLSVLFVMCSENKQKDTKPEIAPVTSLLGNELLPPEEDPKELHRKDSLLQLAQKALEADPTSLSNLIWVGRRTAYLWRHQEAIDIFTKGLQHFPESPELYRHRGHRYISTRQLDLAVADFEKAAILAKDRDLEIEPDGIPNRINQPLSNLHFNIYYHLGLACYLKGDFSKAAVAYEECMKWSLNADLQIATTDWLYMTYRRMGQKDKATTLIASIPENLELIENDGYYERILLYKGLKKPEELLNFGVAGLDDQVTLVTQGYGVANWYLYNDQPEKAKEVFQKILELRHWSAFGYIAAEADMARLSKL